MSGGKKGLCPACGMTERLRPVLSRKDGFVMNNVCAKCLRQISMSAHCIRSMSVAMVLGMTLNPEGGVMKLGNRYFQFKPVEGGGNGEYWDEVEAAGVGQAVPQGRQGHLLERRCCRRLEKAVDCRKDLPEQAWP